MSTVQGIRDGESILIGGIGGVKTVGFHICDDLDLSEELLHFGSLLLVGTVAGNPGLDLADGVFSGRTSFRNGVTSTNDPHQAVEGLFPESACAKGPFKGTSTQRKSKT